MKHTVVFSIVAASILVVLAPLQASADEAVDQLVKDVIGDARSNADRAAKLYGAAEVAKDTPDVQVVLLCKSVEYGMKSVVSPEARGTVQSAIAALRKAAPERNAEWTAMDLDLHRRWFRATKTRAEKETVAGKLIDLQTGEARRLGSEGKWLEAAAAYREAYSAASMLNLPVKIELARDLRFATHSLNVLKKVEQYKTALKAKPDSVATRTLLVNALVVDLDAPARAVEYLNDDVDQACRTYVPLAAKDASDVQGDVCREMGDWYYKALAPKAVQLSKPAMLVRAQTYYQQFLDGESAKGLAGVAVKMTVSKIDKELEKLGSTGVSSSHKPGVVFHADKSMRPFKKGKKFMSFPVQESEDARSPFAGKGVYFDQKTGKDVVYEIRLARPIRAIYYKGAAVFKTRIEVWSPKGKLLSGIGPLKGQNTWAEFTLKVPRTAGRHFFLKFHNTAGQWFYIDTIKLIK